MGAEQEECEIDGMEGSRSPGAGMASVRMDKSGAFEWKRCDFASTSDPVNTRNYKELL